MRKFGIRMDGCELPITNLVLQHVAMAVAAGRTEYTFLEIGSAGCKTLRAIADIISKAPDKIQLWRAVGTDLPPGSAWSLDMKEVEDSFSGVARQILYGEPTELPAGMSLILNENPRAFLSDKFPSPIDLALIDGCHGRCSALDFEAIEKRVSPGGVVLFHDYGEPEQGTDWQSHCGEFISVRNWVHRLGLARPCPKDIPRAGWRWVGEIKGSRYLGGDGNSCAVVQRTLDKLQDQEHLKI